MTEVISATRTRFDRMSPTAAALALLLHAATALALWWVSPLNQRATHLDGQEAIDVTIEQPKPAPSAPEARPSPPPAPSAPSAPPPAPPKANPAPLGLPPPSPTLSEKPERAAPKQEPQQALTPKETTPPPPPQSLENSLPPIEAPPPPLTSKEFPKPPPAPAPARPRTPAPPAAPQKQLRPSPLPTTPRTPPDNPQATAPSATFINPADQYNQEKLIERYLGSVAYKISQYRYHSSQANEQGTVVLRLVISRDGRLLDVSIARSSGIMNLDRGLMEAARAAAPYAPLPSVVSGPQRAFIIPFASVYRPQ